MVKCECESCKRGDTLGRLEASVVGPDPDGVGVMLRPVGTHGRGVPFVPDLGVMSSGTVVPSLRAGATVALTHAHPVWRRALEYTPDEGGEDWGLRAIGACVRTRVRTVMSSPLCTPTPALTSSGDREGADTNEMFTRRDVARACERGGIVAAVRLRDMAAALRNKFDCADPGQRRNANRLLLGKRKRLSVGGGEGEEDEASTTFDMDGALRRLGGDVGTDPQSTVRRGQSIYHEFFSPAGLGGDERPVPVVPTLRHIVDAGVDSFTAAVAAETCVGTDGAKLRKSAAAALPFGGNAGAVAVDRVVMCSREFGEPGPALLLGWLKEYRTGEGTREKRRYALTDHTTEIEVCLTDDCDLPPLPCMMAATRWSLACEGAKESVTDSGVLQRQGPRVTAAQAHRAQVPPSVQSVRRRVRRGSRQRRKRAAPSTLWVRPKQKDQVLVGRVGVGEGHDGRVAQRTESPADGGRVRGPYGARGAYQPGVSAPDPGAVAAAGFPSARLQGRGRG